MILTLTANPSLDRTIELGGPVLRGQVQRAVWAGQQPGGKGVNVSRAVAGAGRPTRAVLPGDGDDPVLTGLDAIGLAHDSIPTGAPIRSNITVTEPDGTTTKINEPGTALTPARQVEVIDLVAGLAADADWVVLAGSLPPGVEDDFYARTITAVRQLPQPPSIAVDTSGAPLAEALRQSPDLIKPNAEELAELLAAAGLLEEAGLLDDTDLGPDADADIGPDADADLAGSAQKVGQLQATRLRTSQVRDIADRLESSPELTAQATRTLLNSAGARPRSILATLGAGGAVLAVPDGSWHGQHPPVEVVSTVGAGDSTLAGYLLARTDGDEPHVALARAVAYGAAAASLRGTGLPTPADARLDTVTVTPLIAPQAEAQRRQNSRHLNQHEGAAPEAEEA
jgi:1-phosphofructokinase